MKNVMIAIIAVLPLLLLKNAEGNSKEVPEIIIAPHQQSALTQNQHTAIFFVAEEIKPRITELVLGREKIVELLLKPSKPKLYLRVKERRWVSR